MKVSGIFKTLITIVACVVLGAFALNILMPNAAKSIVNATEGMIYNATSMSFDFNGDGLYGEEAANQGGKYQGVDGVKNENVGGAVKGFGNSENKNSTKQ